MNRIYLTFIIVLCCIFARGLLITFTYDHLHDDAAMYDEIGGHSAWSTLHDRPNDTGLQFGTDSYARLTGFIYVIFGHRPAVMMVLNSALALLGSYIFYSLVWALYPRANIATKALMFLDPSMLFWTSIHGKDPLVFFLIAACCGSFYKIVKGGNKFVYAYLAALAGLCLIRPQVAILIALAGLIVLLKYKNPAMKIAFFISIISAASMAALILIVYSSDVSLLEQLATLVGGLATGGSAIGAGNAIMSWGDFAWHVVEGIIAVLFRPFPWESSSPSLIAAALYRIPVAIAELLVFAYFFVKRKNRYFHPFAKFAGIYCLLLIMFMAIITGNLGTLDRARVQLNPLIWLLLAARSSRAHTITGTLKIAA